jgi:tyrosine-protein kinase Etk/Wzc
VNNTEQLNSISNLQEDNKPMDIRRLFGLIRRYWYLLVILPFLFVSLAVLYTRYLVDQYKITSTILIRKDDKQKSSKSVGNFDASSLFNGNASNTADEVEILKSRTLMSEVLTQLKINPLIYAKGRLKNSQYYDDKPISVDTYYLPEKIRENPIGFVLDINVLDNTSFEVLQDKQKINCKFGVPFTTKDSCYFSISKRTDKATEQKTFSINFNGLEILSKNYLSKLSVVPIKGASSSGSSNAITISLEDEIPKRGVAILSKLIDEYNRFGVEDKNRSDKGALTFIDSRVDLLTNEVNVAEHNIEDYKKAQGISADAASGLNFLFNKIGSSDSRITELEIRKSVFQALKESFNTQETKNDFTLMPTNLVENNSPIAPQIVEYNKLVLERIKLLKFAKKENTAVISLENQILDTRKVIQDNIETNLRNLQQEITLSLDKLKSENTLASKQLRETPTKERGLLEITRLKNLKESIYLFLLQKREETALSLATTVTNARVLDPPISSTTPIKPNKRQIIFIAAFIGLLIAISFTYVFILLHDSIETEDDIRNNTSTPFLGYLTMNKGSEKQIVVEKGSRTATVETFRLLRSNLQFMLASTTDKTVLITSSMSGEGKSFVTLNLGVSMALSGKKTIIIGFDLRKPKLTSYLQNTSDKGDNEGLTNYLVGDVDISKIIHVSKVNPLLYYISSGPVPPNPSELIMQERTDKLFEYLKTVFDFIIIDTPPIGMVVDAVILAKYASTSVYVTRFNVTKKGQLRIIDRLYVDKKLPNPSIVLNAVPTGNSYGYGYGYGYGYAYGEDTTKTTFLSKVSLLGKKRKK